MKHSIFNASIPLSFILFFCWNGTLVDSGTKSKLPDVNFYGTIEGHNGTFNYEYLLFNKKYEGISAYPYLSLKKLKKRSADQPAQDQGTNKQDDPTKNIAKLNLNEIKTIELQDPHHPTASTVTINQKDYVEITVTLINGTKNNYLIEAARNITCKEIAKGSGENRTDVLISRELSMTEIKKLTIKGYKSVKESEEKEVTKSTKEAVTESDQKKEVRSHTENLLDQIEENVKNLSQENSSTFEKMKSNIIALLKLLREQLQKMLNLLQ